MVVRHLPSKHETVGSILSTANSTVIIIVTTLEVVIDSE